MPNSAPDRQRSRPQSAEAQIRRIYRSLSRAWGPQHWWPAQSRFEVIAGALLTQNTAWKNVERALANLRARKALSVAAIRALPITDLEQLVRPSGYFRQKAARLKTFVAYLDSTHRGSLQRMFAQPTSRLREELLALNGIGPETADAILLYAGNHPVFVVDAYARRIFRRHGLIGEKASYEEVRSAVESALASATVGDIGSPAEWAHAPSRMSARARSPMAQRLNEMHGLLVNAGKLHCHKAEAHCDGCPLARYLPSDGTV